MYIEKNRVEADLRREGVEEILKECGYAGTSAEKALDHLERRIGQCEEFPHEIGLFLGYPLGDVRGFIENQGRNLLHMTVAA